MAKEGLTPDEAIESIRKARPVINPNSGFRMQLELFHEMGCKLDPQHEAYRLYKMKELGKQWWNEKNVETDELAKVMETVDLQVCKEIQRLFCQIVRHARVLFLEVSSKQGRVGLTEYGCFCMS